MRPRVLLAGLACLLLAAACVRLSFWQLSRWNDKRRWNADCTAALAKPVLDVGTPLPGLASTRGRRVRLTGTYERSWHVVLDGRWVDDSAGVELVTPLRLADGEAVLVDRGWLASADAMSVEGNALVEPGEVRVTGIAEPLLRGRGIAWSRLPRVAAQAWSARTLDPDSLRAHAPFALAPWVLHALADPATPARFVRTPPLAENAAMHASYALQWLLFALAFVAGGTLIAVRDRAARVADRGA